MPLASYREKGEVGEWDEIFDWLLRVWKKILSSLFSISSSPFVRAYSLALSDLEYSDDCCVYEKRNYWVLARTHLNVTHSHMTYWHFGVEDVDHGDCIEWGGSCDVIHSHVLFPYVTWVIHIRIIHTGDMTYSYITHWHLRVADVDQVDCWETGRLCDVMHWHDSFTCVTWLIRIWFIHTRDMTHSQMTNWHLGVGNVDHVDCFERSRLPPAGIRCEIYQHLRCVMWQNLLSSYRSWYVTEHVDRSDQSALLLCCQIYQYLRCVLLHILLLWSDHILLLLYVRCNVQDMTDSCVTQLIHMWHKSTMVQWCVTWLIHV